MAALLPLLTVAACDDGGRPAWKAETAKTDVVAGYVKPPSVLAARSGRGGTALAGLATPGARVLLVAPDGGQTEARADDKGAWMIMAPPTATLRLYGLAMTVGERSVQAEGFLALTPDGRLAQLRPGAGALVLSPASRRPRILALDFDRDGAAMVSGVGTISAEVGLRLDRTAAGGSMIDRQGRFSFALSRPMSQAAHDLEISGEGGEDTVTVTTSQPTDPGDLYRASRLAGAWRIDWRTPGGGVQSTLLFDPVTAAR
ncbi:MAG: hypothetical protein K9G59_11975 [Caulobacter sp.]|nr:hypothetical protein [Caulobacter sp.]